MKQLVSFAVLALLGLVKVSQGQTTFIAENLASSALKNKAEAQTVTLKSEKCKHESKVNKMAKKFTLDEDLETVQKNHNKERKSPKVQFDPVICFD